MTKNEMSFDQWFVYLQMQVLNRTGVLFRDRDRAQQRFEAGCHAFDMADEVKAECLAVEPTPDDEVRRYLRNYFTNVKALQRPIPADAPSHIHWSRG